MLENIHYFFLLLYGVPLCFLYLALSIFSSRGFLENLKFPSYWGSQSVNKESQHIPLSLKFRWNKCRRQKEDSGPMFNSSGSTSLHQMASGDDGQLNISKVWVLRASQKESELGKNLKSGPVYVRSQGTSREERGPLQHHDLPDPGEIKQNSEKICRGLCL